MLARLLWGDMAEHLATLGTYAYYGMDYHYLADVDRNGEVQIFRQYRNQVTAARRARIDLLGPRTADRLPRKPNAPSGRTLPRTAAAGYHSSPNHHPKRRSEDRGRRDPGVASSAPGRLG
ncbi:Uncharacterised protein [Nocardia brasiliensis]|nr:Uncharacterised protein [Nocardia brasiliensis]